MASVKAKIGKELGFGLARSGLARLYHEITDDSENSFKNEVCRGVRDSQSTLPGFRGRSLYEVAAQYGLQNEFDQYMRTDVVGGIRGNLARALDVLTSVKDSLEDVIEGAEVTAAVGAGAVSEGAGTVVVEALGTTVEVPAYLAIQAAYTGLATILGYASGTYTFTPRGTKAYIKDVAKGFAGALGNAIPVVGSLLELSCNLDDKRPTIIQSAARRTEYWLANRLREKGVAVEAREPEKDLVRIIDEYKGRKKARAEPELVDYDHAPPAYATDVGYHQDASYPKAA